MGLGSLVLIVLLVGLGALIYRTGSSAPQSSDASNPGPTAGSKPTAACEVAPKGLLDMIGEALAVDGGGSVGRGMAVRSGAHANAYFVAAEVRGPGLDNVIGVWATNRLDGSGMIFSVDAMAREFSVLPDGSQTDAAFSMLDPGASESRACLR